MSEPSAEMRAAAQRLRELAGAATKPPWTVHAVIYGKPEDGWGEPSDFEIHSPPSGYVVTHQMHEGGGIGHKPDAELIAAMHPGVALAVARLLEDEAAEAEATAKGIYGSAGADFVYDGSPVLALARLVLEAK
jgi:hypothetical protein